MVNGTACHHHKSYRNYDNELIEQLEIENCHWIHNKPPTSIVRLLLFCQINIRNRILQRHQITSGPKYRSIIHFEKSNLFWILLIFVMMMMVMIGSFEQKTKSASWFFDAISYFQWLFNISFTLFIKWNIHPFINVRMLQIEKKNVIKSIIFLNLLCLWNYFAHKRRLNGWIRIINQIFQYFFFQKKHFQIFW